MDDLIRLNRSIAVHWLGVLDSDHEAYLSYAPVCLGQLLHSPAELAEVAGCTKLRQHNCLSVAQLNRQYLRFARLAAKDVAAGKLEMLIKLGITVDQAEVLGNLNDEALTRLAFGWDGPIMQFARQAFERGVALHVRAAKHHATAFVATRLAI